MNPACHFGPLLNRHLLRYSITLQSLLPASDWQSLYKLTAIQKEQNRGFSKAGYIISLALCLLAELSTVRIH